MANIPDEGELAQQTVELTLPTTFRLMVVKTNGGSGAGWGAGGGLNLKKKGCALDPSSYFDFLVAVLFHVWGSCR